MPRVYVACKFRPTDARAFTYYYDGEEPLQVGDTVKVPDRYGDGWKRVEVVSITHEEPPFLTKGIIGLYQPDIEPDAPKAPAEADPLVGDVNLF